MESLDTDIVKKTKEPKDSKFSQQHLKAWRPVWRPVSVVMIYLLMGIALIFIATLSLLSSKHVSEVTQRYDDLNGCYNGTTNAEKEENMKNKENGYECNLILEFQGEGMKAPIYVYYEIDAFYQNHRRYVKSRSDEQLAGKKVTSKELSDCEPQLYLNGDKTQLINPCGLTAWTYFNDTFEMMDLKNMKEVPLKERGIAWQSDLDHKFSNYEPENFNTKIELRGGGTIEKGVGINEDEHFVVWMKNSAVPKIRKLYAVIEQDIEKNALIEIKIKNKFNTYGFDGQKSLILSTTSWMGGKNGIVMIAYFVTGCICLFCSILFFVLHIQLPRDMGDERFLSWNRKIIQ